MKTAKPCFVKVTFANPERGEQDISNALDMADFPADVEEVDVPGMTEATKEAAALLDAIGTGYQAAQCDRLRAALAKLSRHRMFD